MNIIIANSTNLHKQLEKNISKKYRTIIINKKDKLIFESIKKFSPDYIFFIHWAYKIPKEIYDNYKCIVFHMTDLPFGRGGSPLQNLIIRGFKVTKLSAIKVVEKLDAGDIYLKKRLLLNGTAKQIFLRADNIIENMIDDIISKNIKPNPQKGKIIIFKRRTPEQSDISRINNLKIVYDYIRMLDAVNYPKAFIETDSLRLEFSNANFKLNKIKANVTITKK